MKLLQKKHKIRIPENKQKFNLKEFLNKAEIPAIVITINNKDYVVMIDTGSDASYLDSSVIDLSSMTLLGHQKEMISGTGIKESGSKVYEVPFTCGNKTFTENFTENDFSVVFGFIEQEFGIRMCGILGTRFLMKYKCILDFDKLVFYL